MLRPVRDMFGSIGGPERLANLILMTVAAMLVVVPIYSWMFNRLSRDWLVRCVYHFFAGSLLVFSVLGWLYGDHLPGLPTCFFVWVNIFGLFATSVFWSVLVDLSSRKSAKRNFGFIAAGGTGGAITGSLSMMILPLYVPLPIILMSSAAVLEAGLFWAKMFERSSRDENVDPPSERHKSLGKSKIFDGVFAILRSPYLCLICVYLFLAQSMGTILYFEQNEIVSKAIQIHQERTTFFATLDFGTQILTLIIQTFLTPTILTRFGLPLALILLPVVYGVGMPLLIFAPSLATLSMVMIASRAIGYGITVPSREILFSTLPQSQQYKSKSFIDTVVMRGSDAIASQSIRIIGISVAVLWGAGVVAVGFAAIGCALGLWARRQAGPGHL